jgi:hypothetical protein
MRVLSYLVAVLMILISGCSSPSHVRADYVRATLPYEAAVLVKGAERIRRGYPDITTSRMAVVDQLIIEDALRLHICLSDPNIAEKDKSYARNVLPLVIGYIATNDVGRGFDVGKEYEMLPHDFMFPPKMKIRDVLDELIHQRK